MTAIQWQSCQIIFMHSYFVFLFQTLVPNKDKVQIGFEQDGLIYLEGAPEEVKKAQMSLLCEIERLTAEMSSETIKVIPSLHRHVIGRGGALSLFFITMIRHLFSWLA